MKQNVFIVLKVKLALENKNIIKCQYKRAFKYIYKGMYAQWKKIKSKHLI